ncbi:MAG: sensor histidine kinase [Nitritalea sp.]
MFSHNYRWLFILFLTAFSFLNIWLLDGDRLTLVEVQALPLGLLVFLAVTYVWEGNRLLQRYLVHKPTGFHVLVNQFLASLLLTGLGALFFTWASAKVYGDPFFFRVENFLLIAGFMYRVNLFLNTVHALFYVHRQYKQKALEAEKLSRLNSEAKLERLNAQMNPHFFFNNLSTLSALIQTDVDAAENYLQQLAKIYRYLLLHKDSVLVSLEDELEFMRAYLALLETRFESALQVEVRYASHLNQSLLGIPPATLQLLIENVVKHNSFTQAQPMHVLLEVGPESIKIANKKQLKPYPENSNGIGLQNIRERYQFLGHAIRVQETPEQFEVVLPMLKRHENLTYRG